MDAHECDVRFLVRRVGSQHLPERVAGSIVLPISLMQPSRQQEKVKLLFSQARTPLLAPLLILILRQELTRVQVERGPTGSEIRRGVGPGDRVLEALDIS